MMRVGVMMIVGWDDEDDGSGERDDGSGERDDGSGERDDGGNNNSIC